MPIEDNEESAEGDTSQDGDTPQDAEGGGGASALDERPASDTDPQPASPSDTDPRPASASDADPQPTSASDTDSQPPESQPTTPESQPAQPMRRMGAWRIAIITTLTVLVCAVIVTVSVWAVENIAPRDHERTVIYYDDLEYREFREDFLPKRLPDFGKERFWEERWSEEGDLDGWHPDSEGSTLADLVEMFRVEPADVLPYLLTLVEFLRDLLGVIQPLDMLQNQLAPEPPVPEPTATEPPAPVPLTLDQLPPLTQEQLDQLFGLLFGSGQGLGALGSLDPSALGLGSLDLASLLGLLSAMPTQIEPTSSTDEDSAQTTTTTLSPTPTTSTPTPATTTTPTTSTPTPATSTTAPSATATPTTSTPSATPTPATTAPST